MAEYEIDRMRASSRPGSGAAMRSIMDRVRTAHAERIWPEIANATPEERASMPHEIDCDGLTTHNLGAVFADEFQGRRLWCREYCRGAFTIEPMWSESADRRDTGRRFLFADPTDAALFRLSWC
jgi:hypothetical protein